MKNYDLMSITFKGVHCKMPQEKKKAYRKRPFHHVIYQMIGRPAAKLLVKKYHFKVENTPPKEVFQKPFIILSNHVSQLDKNFMIAALPHQAYFVATEDIFCKGALSRVVRAAFDPIPLFKPDLSTAPVRSILKRIRGGDSIIMYPEGHHSPDGLTTDIKDSVGALIKAARCQLITFRMINGFFMAPRWCSTYRTGPVRGEYVGVYSPEELAKMSAEEITALICRDLHEDAYARQKAEGLVAFQSDRRAEQLEVHYYICPICGAHSQLHSHGNTFHCEACGNHAEVDEYYHIRAVEGSKDFPFDNFTDWANWQRVRENEFISSLDRTQTVYRDTGLHLIEYRIDEAKTLQIADTDATASFEGFTVEALNLTVSWNDLPWFNFNQGGRGFQFVFEGHHYELWGETFCAARYGNLYFRSRSADGSLNMRY